uniref:Uncharacterized protein n=1 Tax=Meloidogyne incognita TaxID=6306 RepID=A0A914MR22_MELIC
MLESYFLTGAGVIRKSLPFIQLPHSGSDFQSFISLAGIPVVDIRMENVPYSFMLYHTAYEVPWLNENFLDTKGLTSVALGQFWLEIVKQLADNILIPFNIEDYCLALYEFLARANAQMNFITISLSMHRPVHGYGY